MVEAAASAGVKLMTAYRLHFDPANLRAVELARSGKLGDLRVFNSTFTMQVRDLDNIRLKRDLGGGPLYDIGIYCINAARYLFGAEPVEVLGMSATADPKRFKEVEEMVSAVLRFPGERVAAFTCSFGASDVATYRLVGEKGDLELTSAYEYAEGMKLRLTVDGETKQESFPKRDQFGPELVAFSECILEGRNPEPSGEEGLADVRIIRAIHESVRAGRPVGLRPFQRRQRPTPGQAIERPAVKKPEVVNATAPGKE
jgi:glucose-fructose oxidoreductase